MPMTPVNEVSEVSDFLSPISRVGTLSDFYPNKQRVGAKWCSCTITDFTDYTDRVPA